MLDIHGINFVHVNISYSNKGLFIFNINQIFD